MSARTPSDEFADSAVRAPIRFMGPNALHKELGTSHEPKRVVLDQPRHRGWSRMPRLVFDTAALLSFKFMAAIRDFETVESSHELKGRARHSVRAAL